LGVVGRTKTLKYSQKINNIYNTIDFFIDNQFWKGQSGMTKYTNLIWFQLILLQVMTWIIIIAMGGFPIISHLEGKESEGWHISLLFLGCSMAMIYSIVKSFDNRLKKIEKQLKL